MWQVKGRRDNLGTDILEQVINFLRNIPHIDRTYTTGQMIGIIQIYNVFKGRFLWFSKLYLFDKKSYNVKDYYTLQRMYI